MSYLEFYNLNKEPFHITPDPEFLYLSPSHKEALGVFLYGVRQRKGIIAVTGEVGVGKTTVLRRYLEKIDPENLKPVYLFNSNISFVELVKLLHEELGVQPSGSSVADMVSSLHLALIQQYKEGKNVVLIVDEAQNMPNETLENLRMLSNLETAKDKLLQIVLIGQPELEEKLNMHNLRQLKQRIAVRATIRPLLDNESVEYIHSRLEKCHESKDPVFSTGAVQAIVKEAQGIPRTMNILCDNALITGYGYEQKPISRKVAKEVISDFRGNLQSSKRYSVGWVIGIFLFLLALSGIAWMMELTPSHYSGGGNAPHSMEVPQSTKSKIPPVSKPKPAATTEQGASLHVKSGSSRVAEKRSLPAVENKDEDEVKNEPEPGVSKLDTKLKTEQQPAVSKPASPMKSLASAPDPSSRVQPPGSTSKRLQPGYKPKNQQFAQQKPPAKVEQNIPPKISTTKEIEKSTETPVEESDQQTEEAQSEAQKKLDIAKEIETERGRKIQLLLQAQQRSAIEAGAERNQDSDSTEDRVDLSKSTNQADASKTTPPIQRSSPSASIPTNTQGVPDVKQQTPAAPARSSQLKKPDATAQPQIRPMLMEIVRPRYPLSGRGKNIEGTVLLSVLVSQRGDVEAIRVVRGIDGYPDFTNQAVAAVRQWKFRPGIDHGMRVKSWVSCPIVFRKN